MSVTIKEFLGSGEPHNKFNERVKWCNEKFGDKFRFSLNGYNKAWFIFVNEEDALLYTLRWS